MKGLVLWGINNIFAVEGLEDHQKRECRIKGKKMNLGTRFYNPLSPGDYVEFEDLEEPGQGLLIKRYDRRNSFARWNKKGRAIQTLGVNMDILFCLVSPNSPPFRPRFLDRALILAELGKVKTGIILNKTDLNVSSQVEERLKIFENFGIPVYRTSCVSREGLETLQAALTGKTAGFTGQSGVGKSSLLNALIPGAGQQTAEISAKMARGRHTTNFSIMIPQAGNSGYIIDTPGIRELLLWGIRSQDLDHWFPEFLEPSEHCSFKGCRHLQEPGCGVKQAVQEGRIHSDRYESYCRMMTELMEAEKKY